MADNLGTIVGIELLTAAQGVEFRAPLRTSPALARVIGVLRGQVAPLEDDRILSGDIEKATALIRSGAIVEASGVSLPLEGG